jgi:hypothetical protein
VMSLLWPRKEFSDNHWIFPDLGNDTNALVIKFNTNNISQKYWRNIQKRFYRFYCETV